MGFEFFKTWHPSSEDSKGLAEICFRSLSNQILVLHKTFKIMWLKQKHDRFSLGIIFQSEQLLWEQGMEEDLQQAQGRLQT